jgi:LacI family transcriptional regulator
MEVNPMSKAVTIQDIADELGLSRNTVSKTLNNQIVPEKTRKLVFDKAIELGYKGLNYASGKSEYLRNQKIMLLTSRTLSNLNFFLSIVRGIEAMVKKYDFELLQYTFNATTPSAYRDLGNYVKAINIDGIICIESFEERFIKMLLGLNIPTTFIDFPHFSVDIPGQYDIVMMTNTNAINRLCSELIDQQQMKQFGFVGDYLHCRGFYERFLGMREALFLHGIPYKSEYSVTLEDTFPYGNPKELKKELLKMSGLPQCFVCANDSIAISLIETLKAMNKRIPEDVSVIGFDNIAEGRIASPAITTVNTDKEYLGRQALVTLLNRIKHPDEKNRIVYTATNIMYRNSTKPIRISLKG